MNLKQIMPLLVLLFLAQLSIAQKKRNCGTMPFYHQENQNPEIKLEREAIERFTEEFIKISDADPEKSGVIYTIPVVFHIVWRTSAENVSVPQIQSQLDVINEDFRRLNSDADDTWPQATDPEIEFCLATVDPDGNPTTGITRNVGSPGFLGFSTSPFEHLNLFLLSCKS